MTFGKRLRRARTEKHMTQKQLADLLSVKHNSISNWENDINKPDPDMIELLCGVLEISPNFLLETSSEDCSPAEKLIIKKYRALDEHGKKMVDFTLQEEWERATKHPMERQISLLPEDGYFKIWRNGKFENWKKVEELLPEQTPILNAAHARTDIDVTAADLKHDDDIMDDENF